MNKEYIEKVFFKKAFSISMDKIKVGSIVARVSVDELEKILASTNNLSLGFTKLAPANKEWLTTVLYSIAPSHSWFERQEANSRLVDAE